MRSRGLVRLLVSLCVAAVALTALGEPASAHPLGNFTTNRLARIEVGSSVLRVRYVLDEAELVAFRVRDEVAADRSGYALRRAAVIAAGLRLRLDGQALALTPVSQQLSEPSGQGGLTTLRLEVLFEADLPVGRSTRATATFTDDNEPDRIGWREITVTTVMGSGARVLDADVPARDRADGLRSYPTDPGVAPLDVRSARFEFVSGSGADGAGSLDETPASGGGRTPSDRFVRLLDETTSSPLAILGALFVALLFGAIHALGPGHGKTVMAAYLVSTQGRKRDALALGAVVSFMHTASVLALAALLATVGRNLEAERLYPVLTVVAGFLVLGVGANLLRRRLRVRVHAPGHDYGAHDHDTHDHDHDAHDHGHGPGGHSHDLAPGVRPLSLGGILALGTSGGLFPSPSAVVVLVGAVALGRAPLGLALITAFSLGLAAVLVTVGLLLVAGRERLVASRFGVTLPWLPSLGAAAITALGVVLIAQGVMQLG